MEVKEEIYIIRPKPFEEVGLKFFVSGKIPKSWMPRGQHEIDLSLIDFSGREFMGTSVYMWPSFFSKFRKKVKFFSHVDLVSCGAQEHTNPRGIIVKISGCGDNFFLLPVIIKGTEANQPTIELKEKLSNAMDRIVKLKKDYDSYKNELQKIYNRTVHNKEILEGVFEILEQSKDKFKTFYESEEDKEEKELREKYKDAIAENGPMLRGIVGRMAGFEFSVYSGDHNPKHFHIIHKSRGINARFSYPQIELIDYKGRSNIIGRKEVEKIKNFFKVTKNFQNLESEFQKQIFQK